MLRIKRKNKQNISSRKYGQVKMRHSKRGVYSCLFAFCVLVTQGVLMYTAYASHGQAPEIVGGLAFMSILMAGIGVFHGIKGFREREKNYIMCKIGVISNALVILLYIGLFVRGLM